MPTRSKIEQGNRATEHQSIRNASIREQRTGVENKK